MAIPQKPDGRLARTFDTVAELYEQMRPGYPDEMFDDIDRMAASGLRKTALEIGAGTGQATRGLLSHGWAVTALEPGPELARVAERVLTGVGEVRVVQTPFESWSAEGRSFDLVIAATSWHWLDQSVAFERAASLLVPDGRLAIVATEHVLPADGDAFFREIQETYEAIGMGDGSSGPSSPGEVRDPDVGAIDASNAFGPIDVRRYLWSRDYSADAYIALISTYSGHIAASATQREQLFSDIRARIDARPSGTVRKHYLTLLQSAQVLNGW